MAWFQLKLHATSEQSESISDFLLDCGALSITYLDAESQPILEPGPGETPLWDTLTIVALYDNPQLAESHLNLLKSTPFQSAVLSEKIEVLEDKDWEREWMDNFKPLQFGESLWICPSWCEPPAPLATNIMLDPGLAFGTGTHPTTELCMQWLATASLKDRTVIDFGCGSGILGIAAAKLGAQSVVAIDNDPQAIDATLSNCNKNAVTSDQLTAYLADDYPNQPVDILLANILAQPLKQLAQTFAKLLKPGGQIVLSGILENQITALLEVYESSFEMEPPEVCDEWVRLTGIRKHS
ncbi:MAG: 50S ribosomal protein L11 methyltransferase [Pseudomonadota bacterium]